jgi:hypothetical protein
LAILDDDPPVRPACHVFVGSKAPWFEITDDLPQYPEYAPIKWGAYVRFWRIASFRCRAAIRSLSERSGH